MKAIALLSGGLDSVLATRVILDQGIEVEALNFVSVFCTCTPKGRSCSAAKTAVAQLGVPLKTINTSAEFLETVKHPRHGYGRNLNPCLDCRIHMFRGAREYMRETGASFIVTGEVLGERPMSQRRDAMRLIDREAGVTGLVVRPLCAQWLEPTLPETEGWIDRARLLAIRGRCRKPQIALAKSYGLRDYPCPSGGCLLTDAGFAARMRDLMAHSPDFTLNDVHLLKVGRHFRLSPDAKAIVGRDDEENQKLLSLAGPDDLLMQTADVPGALTVVRGPVSQADVDAAASLTAWYSKARQLESARIEVRRKSGEPSSVAAAPKTSSELALAGIDREKPQLPESP